MDALFKPAFPNLVDVANKKTSEYDEKYNCIAWALAEDQKNFWWPNRRGCHWPVDATGKSVTQAFDDWFNAEGWEETASTDPEDGYQKVALYTLNGQPTHAARMIAGNLWTSKLGSHIDLSHDLRDLEGGSYGSVSKIYKKPIP